MKNIFKSLSDFNKSVLLSVAFHAMLLLLFLVLRSGIDFPDTEFAEIGFVASTTSRAYRPTPQKSTPVKTQTEAPQQEQAGASPAKEDAAAPPVNIPKRRMLEDEEPQLTRRKSGKLSPTADDLRPTPRKDIYDAESTQKQLAERAASGKEFSQPTEQALDGKDVAAPGEIGASRANMPYTIEGDAAKRTIVNQVLPEYPPGLQQEAVVKIRFWVLPDGRIGAMLPLRKGDPVLDQVTMRAMRQWRFNALPDDVEQKNVEGVITFVYKLR